jgi:hypothetical protein
MFGERQFHRLATRLAAQHLAIEDQNRETLRSGVHSGRKAGGSRSDHGDVVESVRSECRGDAKPGGGFFIRRPLEHAATSADEERQVLGREGKIVDELAAALARAIENQMGIGVSGQERLQTEKVGGAGTAEQNRTDTALQQAHAPQNKGAHNQLTEFGGSHDERAQPCRVQRQRDAAVRACPRAHKGRPIRQLIQLARELTAFELAQSCLFIQPVTAEHMD